jgi:putative ABC transport system substrate-binding protein
MPVVGLINLGTPEAMARYVAAFRNALIEAGYVEGQNVTVEYHWLEGQYDRLPALMADLVRRRVAIIATPGGTPAALAAKAATTTIPIVFGVAENPVRMSLVANLARPGGNATGVNFFLGEVLAKRLGRGQVATPPASPFLNTASAPNGWSCSRRLRHTSPESESFTIPSSRLRPHISRRLKRLRHHSKSKSCRMQCATQKLSSAPSPHSRQAQMAAS